MNAKVFRQIFQTSCEMIKKKNYESNKGESFFQVNKFCPKICQRQKRKILQKLVEKKKKYFLEKIGEPNFFF